MGERTLSTIGTLGGLLLGGVLLLAALTKALDPVLFAEVIEREGVAFLGSWTAIAAIAVEVVLGACLVLGVRTRPVLLATLALVVFFLFLNGRAYWRFSQGLIGETEECGCFGSLVERTPAEAFWQDLALLVPALGASFLGRGRGAGARPPVARYAVAGLLGIAAAGFARMAPDLPLDDLATRLKPGVAVSDLCAGSEDDGTRVCLDVLLPELEHGSHRVILARLDDETLTERVDRLNEEALTGARRLWLLTPSPGDEVQAFVWSWGPAFEVREVPGELLRPLYRRLPRSFVVDNGLVVETAPGIGLPPS